MVQSGQPLQRLAKTLKLAYKFMGVFYELVNSNQPDAKDSSKLKIKNLYTQIHSYNWELLCVN